MVVLVSMFPLPLDKIKSWIFSTTISKPVTQFLPCSDLKVEEVWQIVLPNLMSESPLRTVDVNGDNIEDIIIGFGTGIENVENLDLYCTKIFGYDPPCSGGLLVLDGLTGRILWKVWLPHPLFSTLCSTDLNSDGIVDCVVTGRGGVGYKKNLNLQLD